MSFKLPILSLSLALISTLFLCARLHAQRPMLVTESAYTSGKHAVEVVGAVEHFEKATAPSPTFPCVLTRLAVIGWHQGVANNVNLDLDWRGYLSATLGNGSRVHDWGDLTLATRVLFFPEKGWRPAIGLRTAVKLPNTKYVPYGLGSNQTDFFSQLLFTKQYGAVQARMNVGLGIVGDPQTHGAQDDVYTLSAAAIVCPNSWLTFFAEAYGLVGYYEHDDKLLARGGALVNLYGLNLCLYGSVGLAGSNVDIGGSFEASERWSIGIALKNTFRLSFLDPDEQEE
jgi:hypothetical protein